jgi:hypothetical protein
MNILFENIGGNTFKLIKETEFYHITEKDNMDSFIKNGIDITKSGTKYSGAGKEQGEGFYVYKNKNNADLKNRIKSTKNSVIVVIDTSFNPENFDIDYEIGLNPLKEFIVNNWDYFVNHYKDFNMYHHVVNGKPPVSKGVFKFRTKDDATSTINCNFNSDGNIQDAKLWWEFIQKWQQIDKPMFDKFEKENLEKAEILKYNGNDKIYPIRIEDVNGNILWKK